MIKRPDFKDKRTWIFVAAGTAVILLAFTAGVLVRGWISTTPGSWGYSSPTAPLPVTAGKLGDPTRTTSAAAAGGKLTGEKAKLQQQMAQEKSKGQSSPAAKNPQGKALVIPQLQAQAAPTLQEGIIEGSEALVSPSLATITNMWQGSAKGSYYQILVGASTENPNQGLVIVIEVRQNTGERIQKVYKAPGKTGQLRIIEVNGAKILMTDSRDARITFDRGTRKFTK